MQARRQLEARELLHTVFVVLVHSLCRQKLQHIRITCRLAPALLLLLLSVGQPARSQLIKPMGDVVCQPNQPVELGKVWDGHNTTTFGGCTQTRKGSWYLCRCMEKTKDNWILNCGLDTAGECGQQATSRQLQQTRPNFGAKGAKVNQKAAKPAHKVPKAKPFVPSGAKGPRTTTSRSTYELWEGDKEGASHERLAITAELFSGVPILAKREKYLAQLAAKTTTTTTTTTPEPDATEPETVSSVEDTSQEIEDLTTKTTTEEATSQETTTTSAPDDETTTTTQEPFEQQHHDNLLTGHVQSALLEGPIQQTPESGGQLDLGWPIDGLHDHTSPLGAPESPGGHQPALVPPAKDGSALSELEQASTRAMQDLVMCVILVALLVMVALIAWLRRQIQASSKPLAGPEPCWPKSNKCPIQRPPSECDSLPTKESCSIVLDLPETKLTH